MPPRITRAIAIATALFLVAGCEESAKTSDKSAEVLKRAESYFAQGQFNAASIEIKNALKENGNSLDAYLLLARVYLQQGNYAGAVKVLKALPQDNLDVVALLAETYYHQGKFKSLQAVLQPLENRDDARNSDAFQMMLARSLIQQNRTDDAARILDTLAGRMQKPEQQASLEVIRSRIWLVRQNPEQQVAALDKALALHPASIEALLEKARLRLQAEDYESAEDLLSQALMALPTTDSMTLQRMSILQAMVSTLSRQGRSVEAMVYSKLIADASPKAQEMQSEFQSAVDQLKSGNVKQAEETLSRLYSTEHAAVAGSLLGLLKFQQGEFREAAQLFEDTVDPETASPVTLRAYAESQLRLQNPAQALKAIEASVAEHPDDPDIQGVYGLSLLATGKTDQGIAVLKAALKLDPSRARLRLALADTFNRQGKLEAAAEQLEAALAANPDDIVLQERLVKQYRAMKKDAKLAELITKLSGSPAPQSQALAGLALLGSDQKRAATLLDKAYAAAPADVSVLRAQVARYATARDPQNQLRFGKELVALNPDDLFALSAIVQAYIAQKEDTAALRFLDDLSQQNANAWGPDFVQAQYQMGQGKIDVALKHAESALARSAFNPATTALASRLYWLQAQQEAANRQFANARETIMDGLQIAPDNVELMHLLVNVELEEKNLKAADKLVAEIAQTAPESHTALVAAADLAQARGETQAALEGYQSAWKLQATDRVGNLLWSHMQKDPADAREKFLAEWQQRLPNSYQALTIEGLFRQENGRASDAINVYRKSLALNPRQSAVLNNLAWLLLEAGDLANAKKHADEARQLNPDNPSILDTYGWIAFRSGDKKSALEALEKAATLLPDNQEIAGHLAEVRKAP